MGNALALSLCIPVYNRHPAALVQNLVEQLQELALEGEILLLDDGSEDSWREKNRKLTTLNSVRYEELPHNVGRAAVRNALALRARGQYLLFLDDGLEISPQWLAGYWHERDEQGVLCGGVHFPNQAPRGYRLRQRYARCREMAPAKERQKRPWEGFKTGAFMVPKALLLRIPFDENLRHYGHEDTLWGYALKAQGIPVRHLDQPAFHPELDTDTQFLHKMTTALQNLPYVAGCYPQESADMKLWSMAQRCRKSPLEPLLRRLLEYAKSVMEWQLQSARPSLLIFDLYRLGRLLDGLRKKAPEE